MPCIYCVTPGATCNHFELLAALNDIKCVAVEWGATVKFRIRKESQIVRDDYNSIKRFNNTESGESPIATELVMKAYPINYNPSQRDLDKSGLKERTEVILYTPRQYWIDASLGIDDIDMERTTVILDDCTYEIRDKARNSQFREDFLYYVFGINKK